MILFTGGGSLQIFRGGVPPHFRGGLFLGGSSKFLGGGVFFWGSSKFSGGVPPNFQGGCLFGGFLQILGGCLFLGGFLQIFGRGGSPPEYGQHSASTHPTGMHSCLTIVLFIANRLFFTNTQHCQ